MTKNAHHHLQHSLSDQSSTFSSLFPLTKSNKLDKLQWCGTDFSSTMASEGPSTKEILLDAVEQTIGADFLKTIEPTDVSNVDENVKGPAITQVPVCSTQLPVPPVFQEAMERKNGLWDIVVGLKEHIPRWVPGSVIKWAAWRAGFKSQDDADYAAQQLEIAAQKWNEANVGVTFEWVPLAKDATFVLTNGGANGTTLARAFFPNGEDLNYVFVYSYAFSQEWKPHSKSLK